MPQKALEPSFLHVYDVELGSWASATLGSPVSPPLLEAMNLILRKDGILAYIGTRSEFGHYLSVLKQETGKDFRHCWTSLPASTIMSMLGLCQSTENPRKPVLVFYGSPLTIALASIIYQKTQGDLAGIRMKTDHLTNSSCYLLQVHELEAIGVYNSMLIEASEHYEALSYFDQENQDARSVENAGENTLASVSQPSQ